MTDSEKPNIVVTGISGGLGLALLPKLGAYRVTGVDLNPPPPDLPLRFVNLDLGLEESCRELFLLLRELRPVALIHLAFAPGSRDAATDRDRMWQINVGGTARVMEALTEVNRDEEIVKKFIFLSCACVYGPNFSDPVFEDSKLGAHTLPFAIQKMESDQAVRQRAPSARDCSVYVLRPATFAGRRVSSHMMSALRGLTSNNGKYVSRLFGDRNPCILPWGAKYAGRRLQFVHVDDVARLIVYILRKTEPEARRLTVLNVAARGEPVTLGRCFELANAKLIKVPGQWTMRQALRLLRKMGISEIPSEATPYLLGEQIMNTGRLHEFLGPYYEEVIQFSASDSVADCFAPPAIKTQDSAPAAV